MWRFLAGVGSTLILVTVGILLWQGPPATEAALPGLNANADASAAPLSFADVAAPPTATEKTREQKRFGRYDKDKNGAVSRDEYLTARRKAYAKLDTNGDGRLSFDEYAVKTTTKFARADRDNTGVLSPTEFVATRVARKSAAPKCPPQARIMRPAPAAAGNSSEAEDDAET